MAENKTKFLDIARKLNATAMQNVKIARAHTLFTGSVMLMLPLERKPVIITETEYCFKITITKTIKKIDKLYNNNNKKMNFVSQIIILDKLCVTSCSEQKLRC